MVITMKTSTFLTHNLEQSNNISCLDTVFICFKKRSRVASCPLFSVCFLFYINTGFRSCREDQSDSYNSISKTSPS